MTQQHDPSNADATMPRAIRLAAALLALSVATASAASAQLLTNLGTPNAPAAVTNLGMGIDGADRVKAVGLTMGSDAYTFGSMDVLLGNEGVATTVTGGIYSNVGGAPGAALATFTPVGLAGGVFSVASTFTTNATFVLAANTTYWFLLDGPSSPSSLAWMGNGVVPIAAPGVTYAGYRFSSNGGASWGASSTPNMVAINGTVVSAVPEPQTYALMATGLLGIVGMARMRRRA